MLKVKCPSSPKFKSSNLKLNSVIHQSAALSVTDLKQAKLKTGMKEDDIYLLSKNHVSHYSLVFL